MIRVAALLSLAALAAGHGAITFPKSRNAADGALEPWKSWYWKPGMTEHGADAAVGSFSESGNNTEDLIRGDGAISGYEFAPRLCLIVPCVGDFVF